MSDMSVCSDLQSLSRVSVTGADVPRLVQQPLQAESLRDLDTGHRVPQVHLVGKEEYRKSPGLDVWVLPSCVCTL